MEYIKKEELKEGDVFVSQLSTSNWLNKQGTNFYLMLNKDNTIAHKALSKTGGFSYENIRLATSEEKHWLNSCIIADKFITFEEAMKTFIPKYVKLLDTGCRINCNIPSNKIYKCSKDTTKQYHFGFFLDNKYRIGFNKNEFDKYLKPSTKEAYDAQFVVKEPEFVLPEKWCVLRNSNNYSIINNWFLKNQTKNWLFAENKGYLYSTILNGSWINPNSNKEEGYTEITLEQFKKYVLKEETPVQDFMKLYDEIVVKNYPLGTRRSAFMDIDIITEEKIINPIIENKTELEIWLEDTKALNLNLEDLTRRIGSCNFMNIYIKLEGYQSKNKAKILFDKWNKEKVMEPLPQFKVIETIETITKVENNEGNQFFIGDTVKSSNNIISKIESFEYNQSKSKILAYVINSTKTDYFDINEIEHYIEPKVVESEFILPEKWCIKQNSQIINDWLNINKQTYSYYCSINQYQIVHFPAINEAHLYSNIQNDYTEITFDQFKKYVLKTEVKKETLLEKAKIIEYSHDFKVGDEIKLKNMINYNTYIITKIEDNVLFFKYENNYENNHTRVLAKNAIKIIKVN